MSEESEKKKQSQEDKYEMPPMGEDLQSLTEKGKRLTDEHYGKDRLYPGGPSIGPGGRFG